MATAFPSESWIYFTIAVIVTLFGFYRVLYFITLGYAFSISGMAVATALLYWPTLEPITALQCGLLLFYGLRLGAYVLSRERTEAYRRERESIDQASARVTLPIKIAIWLSVTWLYFTMFTPCLYQAVRWQTAAPTGLPIGQIVGVVIMASGLLLESWSDRVKSAFKNQHPKDFCNVGIYRWVRCPNYLGEIMFWTGQWVAGISAYGNALQWGVAIFGYVCIVLIMMGSTKRLERRQQERYGHQTSFQEYVRTVPVLFPFVPVYSLRNVRVFLE